MYNYILIDENQYFYRIKEITKDIKQLIIEGRATVIDITRMQTIGHTNDGLTYFNIEKF